MTELAEEEKRFDDWTRRAGELWTPDAQQVVNLLNSNDVVFVSGPSGAGKTSFLTPKIMSLATAQNWQSASEDTSRFMIPVDPPIDLFLTNVSSHFKQFPNVGEGKTGVMILDEVGWLDKQRLTGIIGVVENKGYKKFVLIPVAKDEETRNKTILRIKEVLSETGKSSAVYTMDQKSIPDKLARELLGYDNTSNEVIDFVLANFPTYLKILDLFRGCKDISAARTLWDSNWNRISPEQQLEVDEKIRKYLAIKETGIELI